MTTTSPAASDAAKASAAANRAAASSTPKAPADPLFAALLDQALLDPKTALLDAKAAVAQPEMASAQVPPTGNGLGEPPAEQTALQNPDAASVMAQLGLVPVPAQPVPSTGTGIVDDAAALANTTADSTLTQGLGRARYLSAQGVEATAMDSRQAAAPDPNSPLPDDIQLAGKPSPTVMALAETRQLQAPALPVDPALLATAVDDVSQTTASVPNPMAASQPPSLNNVRPDAPLNLPALPAQHPAFGERLGETVSWMMNRGLQEADIRISPENLGPVRIKLRMEGQDAVVSFVVPQDTTRQAIEQNLETLRQALSQAGVTLGETTVSAHSGQQTESGSGQGNGQGQERGKAATNEPAVAMLRRISVPAGRVDLFA